MSTTRTRLFTVLALALASSPAAAVIVPLSDAGANAAAIADTVTAFQLAVGNPNNGNAPGPLPIGRREINWDGGGGVTATAQSPTPFNGFQNTRGALFTTPGTGFVQATPAGLDTLFGRSDNLYGTSFLPFSPLRVFTPLGDVITDVTFSIPGSGGSVPATVSAFGAIFLDVDFPGVSSLQLFELDGDSLGTFFVSPADQGLSFLGLQGNAGERIGRVRITTGNGALTGAVIQADQVVLDDFIYAEPQAALLQGVPEPSALTLLGIAGAALVGFRRRKQNAV